MDKLADMIVKASKDIEDDATINARFVLKESGWFVLTMDFCEGKVREILQKHGIKKSDVTILIKKGEG